MWTITLKVLSHSLLHNNSRLSSATGQVRLSKQEVKRDVPCMSTFTCSGIFLSIFHVSITGCDAFFKIRYRLREHMRSHTQERLVACPTCGSMFSSNTKLFDHLHRQAEPVGKKDTLVWIISVLYVLHKNADFCTFTYFIWTESLVCEHCGKAFPSERLLRDHVRQHGNLFFFFFFTTVDLNLLFDCTCLHFQEYFGQV